MKTSDKSISEVFGYRTHYYIPKYQRHYVWDMLNEWSLLWEDLEKKSVLRANGRETTHFTGAIVTRKDDSETIFRRYEIIDGQQRLTTFQIILSVIRDISNTLGYTEFSKNSVEILIKNDDTGVKSKGESHYLYKLYPFAKADWNAFRDLMNMKAQVESYHLIHSAYFYFKHKIEMHVRKDNDVYESLNNLFNSVCNDFKIVQIEIDVPTDDAEAMFQSLNARGKMLDQFDYLRNNLFLRAGDLGDSLYESWWKDFEEKEYWAQQRELDAFFQMFLKAKLGPDCLEQEDESKK